MKIINILFSNKNGGVEQSFVSYCKLLKDLNHQVLAIVKTGAPYQKDLAKIGIKVVELNNRFGYYDLFAIHNIKKLISDFESDLLFCHVGRAMVLSRKAITTIHKKIPIIAVNHSTNIKRSIGADVVLSVNQEIRDQTIALGQQSSRSFVMNNFIELSDANAIASPPLFSADRKIIIGALSRLTAEKGLEYLIKAIKILKDKNYDVELRIAGDGRCRDALEDLVARLNLGDEIEFLGWIDDKNHFFNNINILCLPSTQETFGTVLLEAMKYDRPIIATDDVGPKSIIKNDVNGLLVERYPLDDLPNKIAESIIKLSNNQDLVTSLVMSAKNDLVKHYSSLAAQVKIKEIIEISKQNN